MAGQSGPDTVEHAGAFPRPASLYLSSASSNAGHRERRLLGEMYLGLRPEVVAEFVGEFLADVIWPAERGSSCVLHADDYIDRQDHPPRVCPLDRLRKRARVRDDLGIGKLPLLHPGAVVVAAGDPHLQQFSPERVVVALASGQQAEPAARPQELRRLM